MLERLLRARHRVRRIEKEIEVEREVKEDRRLGFAQYDV